MKHVNKKLTELSTEMLYFKNPELARLYHVTLRTVLNWIEAAKQGKLDLTLHTEKGRSYIANTTKNTEAIKRLVEERKKYRNSRAVKVVTPRPEFYKLYNQAQIYDIVTNLEIHHEIPRQYNYFDGGAGYWDEYVGRLAAEKTPNAQTSNFYLFSANESYLDSLISKYERINVLDIGVGNALPAKRLLSRLLDKGVLGRYAAIDISPDMLKIAESNVKQWFGDKVAFEGYELDISHNRFTNILAETYIKEENSANFILLLGGTLGNFRNPDGAYRVIHDSMGVNDYLFHTQKLDSDATRRNFDFRLEQRTVSVPPPMHKLVVDLLGIDDSLYELELGYDEVRHERYERIRFKVAVTLKIDFQLGGTRMLEIHKGEAILLWRFHQQTGREVLAQFDRNDFYVLHSSQTEDHEYRYMLTVSQVKRD